MKRFLIILLNFTLVFSSLAFAKKQVVEEDVNEITDIRKVDKLPEFSKGLKGLNNYLKENVKYPEEAIEQGITGIVMVSFTIDKEGNIQNVKAVSTTPYEPFVEEAIRVVNAMPKWKPAIRKKQPVNVRYALPISFKLN